MKFKNYPMYDADDGTNLPGGAADPNQNATPNNGTMDLAAMQTFLKSLEGNPAAAGLSNQNADPNQAGSSGTPAAQPQDNNANQNQDSNAQAQQNTTPDNGAFARMRIENRQLQEQAQATQALLTKLGTALGVDLSDPSKLNEQLAAKANESISQSTNIPPEYLTKLDQMDGMLAAFNQQQRMNTVVNGLKQLETEYGLKQEEALAFYEELKNAGKDPVTNANIDVVSSYRTIHYNDILNREVQKVIMTMTNASQNSSSPNQTQGQGGGQTVGSVGELRGLLNNM